MIKQITCKEIKEYLKKNPKCVLLDVRTEEEWNVDGKPDGEKIALKTHFITIQFADKTFNQSFIEDFKKLNIEKINNLVCFFQKIDDIFISKYIRDVFCAVKKDNKESFQPWGEINVLINHNIQSNIDFIEKSQPKYEFPKTYAYLKHPVFSNSIHLYKKS